MPHPSFRIHIFFKNNLNLASIFFFSIFNTDVSRILYYFQKHWCANVWFTLFVFLFFSENFIGYHFFINIPTGLNILVTTFEIKIEVYLKLNVSTLRYLASRGYVLSVRACWRTSPESVCRRSSVYVTVVPLSKRINAHHATLICLRLPGRTGLCGVGDSVCPSLPP